MVFPEEEARAEAYRAQQLTRQAYRKTLATVTLAGDDDAADALKERWQPLMEYLAERRQGENFNDYETGKPPEPNARTETY